MFGFKCSLQCDCCCCSCCCCCCSCCSPGCRCEQLDAISRLEHTVKSDQVASRNWRRGQCQSLSLSRSRSWQQRSLQRSVICALALAFNLFALCATATIPPPLPPTVQGTLAPHATSLVLCRQLGLALGLNCATVHRYRWAYLHNYRFIPSRPPFSILHSIAFHCILHSTAFPSPPSPILLHSVPFGVCPRFGFGFAI